MKLVAYDALLSGVLRRIRPTPKTQATVESLGRMLVSEIEAIVEKLSPGCLVEVEGSVAKGTYLEKQHDIDVFVFYPPETPREKMEQATLDLGRKWAEGRQARYQIAYAEHPYVRVFLDHEGLNFKVDVVGAFLITSTTRLKSAVDRTRFHTAYIRKKMGPQLRDQILLTKQFMKGTGVYGSESRVGGFSGLLCEVLTIAHGSFLQLLKSAGEWRPGQIVDVERLSTSPESFNAALVVIDPTDGRRNAGAAVSLEKMCIFIHAARSFLEDPNDRYFFPKTRRPLPKSELRRILKERRTRLLVIEFEKPDVIDDILYPQIDRMTSALRGQLVEMGFTLVGPETDYLREQGGTIHILLELGIASLPRVEKRCGPGLDRPEHARRFLQKHRQRYPYLEGANWCVDAPRKYSEAEELVSFILSSNPQGILPSHLADALSKGFTIRTDEEAVRSASPIVRQMLTEHFSRMFPWQIE